MNGKFSYCCWWTHRKWCVRDTLPWSQGLAPLFFPSAQLSNEIFQYPYLTCCHDAVKMLEIHLFVSLTRFIKRNNPFFFWQKRHTKKKVEELSRHPYLLTRYLRRAWPQYFHVIRTPFSHLCYCHQKQVMRDAFCSAPLNTGGWLERMTSTTVTSSFDFYLSSTTFHRVWYSPAGSSAPHHRLLNPPAVGWGREMGREKKEKSWIEMAVHYERKGKGEQRRHKNEWGITQLLTTSWLMPSQSSSNNSLPGQL